MMQIPSPQTLLSDEQYEVIDSVSHDEIVPFVQRYMRMQSRVTLAYWLVNAVFLGMLVYAWLGLPFFDGLMRFGVGVILGYLLIIPHEHIHALAFRLFQATDIRIIYNWRQLSAYCAAHHAVLNAHQFFVVAILPFIVITTLLVLLLVLFPAAALVWCGALVFHTMACSGDLALLNLTWLHREKTFYTFDDLESKVTYFITAQ